MIVLDTQALVWLVEASGELGAHARELEADSDVIAASAISLWEIGLLVSRSKLALSLPLHQWADRVEQEAVIDILGVSRSIAIDAGMLPDYEHGDPGDRIVLATARFMGCPVMTSDRRMLEYAQKGHVRAIDARR